MSTWENCCICVSSSGDAAGANRAEWRSYYGNKPIIPPSARERERERENRQGEEKVKDDGERMKRRERGKRARDEDKEMAEEEKL